MKKVLLLLLVILVAVPVSAQKKFTFGPRVGFTVADLHADDDEKNDEISIIAKFICADYKIQMYIFS